MSETSTSDAASGAEATTPVAPTPGVAGVVERLIASRTTTTSGGYNYTLDTSVLPDELDDGPGVVRDQLGRALASVLPSKILVVTTTAGAAEPVVAADGRLVLTGTITLKVTAGELVVPVSLAISKPSGLLHATCTIGELTDRKLGDVWSALRSSTVDGPWVRGITLTAYSRTGAGGFGLDAQLRVQLPKDLLADDLAVAADPARQLTFGGSVTIDDPKHPSLDWLPSGIDLKGFALTGLPGRTIGIDGLRWIASWDDEVCTSTAWLFGTIDLGDGKQARFDSSFPAPGKPLTVDLSSRYDRPTLETLCQLTDTTSSAVTASLPTSLVDTVDLQQPQDALVLVFEPADHSLRSAGFRLNQTTPWSLTDGVQLSGGGLDVTLTRATKTVTTGVTGTLTVTASGGTAQFTSAIAVSVTGTTIQLRLIGSSTVTSLGPLLGLLSTAGVTLPDGLAALPTYDLTSFVLRFDTAKKTVSAVELTANVAAWGLTGDGPTFAATSINASLQSSTGPTAVTATITTTLTLGATAVTLRAERPAEGATWAFSGALPAGQSADLLAAVRALPGGAALALPAGATAVGLPTVLTLTSAAASLTPATGKLTLTGSTAVDWEFTVLAAKATVRSVGIAVRRDTTGDPLVAELTGTLNLAGLSAAVCLTLGSRGAATVLTGSAVSSQVGSLIDGLSGAGSGERWTDRAPTTLPEPTLTNAAVYLNPTTSELLVHGTTTIAAGSADALVYVGGRKNWALAVHLGTGFTLAGLLPSLQPVDDHLSVVDARLVVCDLRGMKPDPTGASQATWDALDRHTRPLLAVADPKAVSPLADLVAATVKTSISSAGAYLATRFDLTVFATKLPFSLTLVVDQAGATGKAASSVTITNPFGLTGVELSGLSIDLRSTWAVPATSNREAQPASNEWTLNGRATFGAGTSSLDTVATVTLVDARPTRLALSLDQNLTVGLGALLSTWLNTTSQWPVDITLRKGSSITYRRQDGSAATSPAASGTLTVTADATLALVANRTFDLQGTLTIEPGPEVATRKTWKTTASLTFAAPIDLGVITLAGTSRTDQLYTGGPVLGVAAVESTEFTLTTGINFLNAAFASTAVTVATTGSVRKLTGKLTAAQTLAPFGTVKVGFEHISDPQRGTQFRLTDWPAFAVPPGVVDLAAELKKVASSESKCGSLVKTLVSKIIDTAVSITPTVTSDFALGNGPTDKVPSLTFLLSGSCTIQVSGLNPATVTLSPLAEVSVPTTTRWADLPQLLLNAVTANAAKILTRVLDDPAAASAFLVAAFGPQAASVAAELLCRSLVKAAVSTAVTAAATATATAASTAAGALGAAAAAAAVAGTAGAAAKTSGSAAAKTDQPTAPLPAVPARPIDTQVDSFFLEAAGMNLAWSSPGASASTTWEVQVHTSTTYTAHPPASVADEILTKATLGPIVGGSSSAVLSYPATRPAAGDYYAVWIRAIQPGVDVPWITSGALYIAPPTDIKVTQKTRSSLDITWTPSALQNCGYQVEVAAASGSTSGDPYHVLSPKDGKSPAAHVTVSYLSLKSVVLNITVRTWVDGVPDRANRQYSRATTFAFTYSASAGK